MGFLIRVVYYFLKTVWDEERRIEARFNRIGTSGDGSAEDAMSHELEVKADRNERAVEVIEYLRNKGGDGTGSELWDDPENERYFDFVYLFGSRMVGHGTWKHLCKGQMYSSIVSVPEEAFVVLALENGIERWRKDWENSTGLLDSVEGSRLVVGFKYQPLQGDKKERVGSWTEEGKVRFNDICRSINEMRKSDRGGVWTRVQQEWKRRFEEMSMEDGSLRSVKKRRMSEESREQGGELARWQNQRQSLKTT